MYRYIMCCVPCDEVYAEFAESIGALSQHADPNPYVPISTRIDAFLRITLIPNLLKSDASVKNLVGRCSLNTIKTRVESAPGVCSL